jgi:hypothetical protein
MVDEAFTKDVGEDGIIGLKPPTRRPLGIAENNAVSYGGEL